MQVTVCTIHQRLRDEHDLAVSLSSLRRHVAANLPAAAAAVTVLRDDPPPGQEAQSTTACSACGSTRSGGCAGVWAFVMVLAASRHMFVQPVLGMDQQAWNAARVAAFTFFDGVPARIVPDNLQRRDQA